MNSERAGRTRSRAVGGDMPAGIPSRSHEQVKAYNRAKLIAGIASSVFSFLIVLALVASGFTRRLDQWATLLVTNRYLALLLFAAVMGVVQSTATFAIGYYSGFLLEHKYKLSNQTFFRWLWERLKGLLVGGVFGLILLSALYYCLHEYGSMWWLPVGIIVTVFSIVLVRLAPILIFPLFYKFTPLQNGSLRERITDLCRKAGVRFEGIFSFNLSKTTRKANAAFTGIGKSKRILLGDTLVENFTEDEIATIFAHELGHYKHRHILIGIAVGVVSTFGGLYVTSLAYEWSLSIFGFNSQTQLAALPLLALWLSLFGLVTSPIGNMLSRHHERQADAYAVTQTGDTRGFVSALSKLSALNIADPEPHPLIEFLFYSHPSIQKRLEFVKGLQLK